MATRPILYLTEHREAKHLSVEQLAVKCSVRRETVWRWEKERRKLRPETMKKVADALGIEPEELWHPPARPSLDAILRNSPDDLHRMAFDIVSRLVKPE